MEEIEETSNQCKPFVYTWVIKNYQDLYYNRDRFKAIISDRFISPVQNYGRHPNVTSNHGYAWRLVLYPNGTEVSHSITLYLAPFKTKFEKENVIHSRYAEYYFEVYRLDSENSPVSSGEYSKSLIGMTKLECDQELIDVDFDLNEERNARGWPEFCNLSTIFLNNDHTGPTHLAFRVYISNVNVNNYSVDVSPSNKLIFSSFSGPSLEPYFNNDSFADIEFTFDCGSKLKASRMALASRSSYFNKMFLGEWIEAKTSSISIKHVKYECFRAMIYFLYTGKLDESLSLDILKDLCAEADMREIDDLKDIVASRIVRIVNEETWHEILICGWQSKNDRIKDAALDYIHYNWEKVKETDKMQLVVEACNNIYKIEELMVARFFGVRK